MDKTCYQNSDFFKFLSKATAFGATMFEKITCGGPGTVENIASHKKNTRQDLETDAVNLLNNLHDVLKWTEKIHELISMCLRTWYLFKATGRRR